MIATISSKGQLTLPKSLREELRLASGARIDLSVDKQGRLLGRIVQNDVLRLEGRAKPSDGRTRSLQEMEEAIAASGVGRFA